MTMADGPYRVKCGDNDGLYIAGPISERDAWADTSYTIGVYRVEMLLNAAYAAGFSAGSARLAAIEKAADLMKEFLPCYCTRGKKCPECQSAMRLAEAKKEKPSPPPASEPGH